MRDDSWVDLLFSCGIHRGTKGLDGCPIAEAAVRAVLVVTAPIGLDQRRGLRLVGGPLRIQALVCPLKLALSPFCQGLPG